MLLSPQRVPAREGYLGRSPELPVRPAKQAKQAVDCSGWVHNQPLEEDCSEVRQGSNRSRLLAVACSEARQRSLRPEVVCSVTPAHSSPRQEEGCLEHQLRLSQVWAVVFSEARRRNLRLAVASSETAPSLRLAAACSEARPRSRVRPRQLPAVAPLASSQSPLAPHLVRLVASLVAPSASQRSVHPPSANRRSACQRWAILRSVSQHSACPHWVLHQEPSQAVCYRRVAHISHHRPLRETQQLRARCSRQR